MKFPALGLAAALVLLTGACSGDLSPSDPSEGEGTLSAVLNGTEWTAVRVDAQQQDGFSGIWADEEAAGGLTLLLQVPNSQGTGSFAVGEAGPLGPSASLFLGSGADQISWRANAGQGSGTVTITELTEEGLVGTFEFEAVAEDETTDPQVITATQGRFDVTYSNP